MNKLKASLKYFRLTLIFASVVFLIMVTTMFLTFCGTFLLAHFGKIDGGNIEQFPLFSFCLVSILIGTFLSILFSKAPLQPFREIMEATDKIAAGNYNVRIHLKGPEELRTLSDKFNHMAAEIGSVEMLRTDFVNNFSHEFKTPIVSIRGFAKALKWEDLSKKERDEYLDIIITEAERLSELSTNVLYLSKLENQSILTDKKNVNISEQIRLSIALLDKKLSEKQIGIIFDSDEFFINGNEEMLKQVWINLLDNAIKFSPYKGKIEIRIKELYDAIIVKISDEGKGISPKEKLRIFDKFYQSDESHATKGNGLGLSIVKKIIDLHNGRISVDSSDKGSTFSLKLKKI